MSRKRKHNRKRKRKPNKGSFRPVAVAGPDPRRHVFSTQDCRMGWWVANIRHPHLRAWLKKKLLWWYSNHKEKKMASPRKKRANVASENGTATAEPGTKMTTADAATMTFPGDPSEVMPSADQSGPPSDPPSPVNGHGERRPLKVLSYQIGPGTFVQCSIWQREAQRRDGTPFTTYDCSIRKRYVDQRDGEWKSAYSFHASELYAVQHALERAASFIAELRAADIPF